MKTINFKLHIFICAILISTFLSGQVVVYNQNFEGTDDVWTSYEVINENEKWNWTSSSFTGSDGGHWATSPFNDYLIDALLFVESPVMDFTGETNMTFSTKIRYQTNRLRDGAKVQYTLDAGTTWVNLGAINQGTNWYNDTDVDGLANNEDGWSGNNNNWETAEITLPNALNGQSNVMFRFVFGSDYINTDLGVSFDDIEITNTGGTIYLEDFNSDDGGWKDIPKTPSGVWQRSNTSFAGNTTDHWHLNPHNNYANLMNVGLTSEKYDFRAFEDLTLSFDLRYDTEANWDGMVIEYTTDSITWIQLGSVGDGTNWYNNTNTRSLGTGTNAWSGNNFAWQTASIQLPDVLDYESSIYFRFRFLSDSFTTGDDGVALDNFKITIPTVVTDYITQSSGILTDDAIWPSTTPPSGALAFVDTNHVITLSGNTTIDYDLSFLSGSILNLNGFTLTSTGDLNFDNTADIDANQGKLIFAKNGDQTIGNASFYDLELAGTGVKTANVPLSVANDLIIDNSNITFNSDCNVTLKSTASGTGRLLEVPSGAIINGEMIMERYVGAAQRTWWHLSSPFSDATVSDWQNNFPITGEFTGASTLDGNNNTSLYYYDESNLDVDKDEGWIAYPLAINSENIEVGRGYRAYLRENKSTILGDTVISTKGIINRDDISLPVTYTPTGQGDDTDAIGWSFIGNPYPSDIDWDDNDWTKTNIDDAIYVWDALNSRYATYIGGARVDGGTKHIASSQGFWVRSNAENPVLTAREGVKASNNTAFLRKEAPRNLLYIEAIENDKHANTAIRFDLSATTGFDGQLDAEYLGGSYRIGVCTYKPDYSTWYAVNSLPDNESLNIPIWVIHDESKITRSLKFTNLSSFDDDASLRLVDAYNSDTILISDDMNYEYTYDGTYATNGAERFSILRSATTLVTSIDEKLNSLNETNVFPTQLRANQNLNVSTDYTGEIEISIVDLMGREVYQRTQYINNILSFTPSLNTGLFNVKIKIDETTKTEKIIVTD